MSRIRTAGVLKRKTHKQDLLSLVKSLTLSSLVEEAQEELNKPLSQKFTLNEKGEVIEDLKRTRTKTRSKAILNLSQVKKIKYKDDKLHYFPQGLCAGEEGRKLDTNVCHVWIFDKNNFHDIVGDPLKWKKYQIIEIYVNVNENHSELSKLLKKFLILFNMEMKKKFQKVQILQLTLPSLKN
eukprot:gene7188-11500_t